MFCCFSPSRRSHCITKSDEKTPLLKTTPKTIINYRTLFAIPYEHVIQDDKIHLQSSDAIKTDAADTYLFFHGTIEQIACVSFADTDITTPVIFATATSDTHFLFERLVEVKHATAINRPNSIRMEQLPTSTPKPSARPFDEFIVNPNQPTGSLDVQGGNIIPKTDND
ncbi:unnamed protein product [Adineta ricciae]|uniref:Uncharacterized protein n=1 Tax=Adineta ricciae TaxID=249248 RepID=A0A813S073_ADIRI|nr:unnamed protein product [Adineta ricciae]CAF0820878.1 unnamed protein product [Adineta ricciae]